MSKYEYGVSLHIQSECEKIRTRKNSVFGHFSRSDGTLSPLFETSNEILSSFEITANDTGKIIRALNVSKAHGHDEICTVTMKFSLRCSSCMNQTDSRMCSSFPCVFCKKVFLKILQNSQENNSAIVSFLIKLQASGNTASSISKSKL